MVLAARPERRGLEKSPARRPLTLLAGTLAGSLLVACSGGAGSAGGADGPGETRFGSNVWRAPGETRVEALARVNATYGPIDVTRVFAQGRPPRWRELEHDYGRQPLVVSFRFHPARVLSGKVDRLLRRWFRSAPTDRPTWWAYFHEPEDNSERGEFSPQQFREAWSHVAEVAESVGNRRLRATLILMCWTLQDQSGRDWRAYVPGSGTVDVLAWDCYAKGDHAATYADPEQLLGPARDAASAVGARWAVAELGARVSQGHERERAEWLRKVGAYATRHRARFVTYFDAPIGGSFRLLDQPSIDAWSRLVQRDLKRRARPGKRHGRQGQQPRRGWWR